MLLVWPLLSTHFSSSESCKDKDKGGGGGRALPIYISSHFPERSGGFAISKDKCYHSTRSAPSSASSLKCTAGSASAASLIDLTETGIVAADAGDSILQRLDGREHRRINDLQHPAKKDTPIFKIVGKVDGISRHIDASSNDPTHWHEYRVVVEIKNRMNKIPAIPPLYDQIQLVTYMLMLGTACGDLVQVVTRGNQSKAKGCYDDGTPPIPLPIAQSSSSASHPSHNHSDHPSPSPTAASHHISDRLSAPSHHISDPPSLSPTAPSHNQPDHLSASPSPPPHTRASIPSLSSTSPVVAPTLKKPKLDMVLDFSVCRVLLNAPPYNHKDYFFSTVMPRLKVSACP